MTKEEIIAKTEEYMKEAWVAKSPISGDAGTRPSTGTGARNAIYGFLNSKGHKGNYWGYPCHAYMSSVERNPASVFSWTVWPNEKQFHTAAEAYFNWILSKDSPWIAMKPYFNHDVEWIKKNGYIFTDLSMPANLLMNFLIATRMPKEWPDLIQTWYERMTQWKVSPEIALVYATLIPNKSGSIAGSAPYDWPLDSGCTDEEYISNFLNHKIGNFNGPFKSTPNMYKPVNQVWGKNVTVGPDKPNSYFMTIYKLYGDGFGTPKADIKKNKSSMSGGYTHPYWVLKEDEVKQIVQLEDKRLRA